MICTKSKANRMQQTYLETKSVSIECLPRGTGFTAEIKKKAQLHVSFGNNILIIIGGSARAAGTFSRIPLCRLCVSGLRTVHSIFHHIRWQMPSEFRSLIDPMLKLQRLSSTNAGKPNACSQANWITVCILNPICIIRRKKKYRKAISKCNTPTTAEKKIRNWTAAAAEKSIFRNRFTDCAGFWFSFGWLTTSRNSQWISNSHRSPFIHLKCTTAQMLSKPLLAFA